MLLVVELELSEGEAFSSWQLEDCLRRLLPVGRQQKRWKAVEGAASGSSFLFEWRWEDAVQSSVA